jgi:hypothetical protein
MPELEIQSGRSPGGARLIALRGPVTMASLFEAAKASA